MNIQEAKGIAHTLSSPSKMPGKGYGLSAHDCNVGRRLAKIKGSVCHGCYALRGAYTWDSAKQAHEKRTKSLREPKWVAAMSKLVARQEYFRWHDSGDLQGVWHLEKIVQVAKNCPDTKFWLPTKEYKVVADWLKANPEGFPKNLFVKLSLYMNDVYKKARGILSKHCSWTGSHTATTNVPEDFNVCKVSNPEIKKASCDTYNCRKCWTNENVSYYVH